MIQLYPYKYLLFFRFLSHLGYYRILIQVSLCFTVGPYWLSTLVVGTCHSQIENNLFRWFFLRFISLWAAYCKLKLDWADISIFVFFPPRGFHWKSPSPIKRKRWHMVYTFFREPQRVRYLQNEICSLRAETMSHTSLPWPVPSMWSAGQQVLPGHGTCVSCSARPSFGTSWKTGDGESEMCLYSPFCFEKIS